MSEVQYITVLSFYSIHFPIYTVKLGDVAFNILCAYLYIKYVFLDSESQHYSLFLFQPYEWDK